VTFLLFALVVIVAPGPDFALTVRNTVARGRRAGMLTGLGVVSGQLIWALATAAGLTALLVTSRPAFVALRMIGAAYLVWLGLSSLLAAWRGAPRPHARRAGSGYRQGFLSNLGNPKMAVFFTSLLPQFGASFGTLAAHGVAFATLTLAWLSFVAAAGDALTVPRLRRALDAITGVALVAFGVRLATERR
jgi:threonine/homoserine/homoserine lactone efflux protein